MKQGSVHSHSGYDAFGKVAIWNKPELDLNEKIAENPLAVARIMKFYRGQKKYIFIRIIKMIQLKIKNLRIKNFLNQKK